MTLTLTDTAASFSRRGLGVLRTAGAVIGGLGLAGIAAGGAALAWGSIERTMPTLRRYDVPIERDVPEVTILQIADLHLFAGQEFLLHFLSDVASSYPGAFVLGSNDYYSPIPKPWTRYLMRSTPPPARVVPDLPYLPMVRQMRDAGWVDLSNASGTLSLSGGTVSLLGTDDAHIFRDRMVAPASSWEEPGALRLGITHAPYTRVVSALTSEGADLILAGHTHGGQIGIPGMGAIITNCDIARHYAKGLNRWEAPDGSQAWLHVSAGLGTSPHAKVRIATRPEASLIHVHPA